jgi:hypothetical protein
VLLLVLVQVPVLLRDALQGRTAVAPGEPTRPPRCALCMQLTSSLCTLYAAHCALLRCASLRSSAHRGVLLRTAAAHTHAPMCTAAHALLRAPLSRNLLSRISCHESPVTIIGLRCACLPLQRPVRNRAGADTCDTACGCGGPLSTVCHPPRVPPCPPAADTAARLPPTSLLGPSVPSAGRLGGAAAQWRRPRRRQQQRGGHGHEGC